MLLYIILKQILLVSFMINFTLTTKKRIYLITNFRDDRSSFVSNFFFQKPYKFTDIVIIYHYVKLY